jgi:16S rRNA processing protein RimM
MLLVVGHVVRSHGVLGEVVVEVRTDEPALRFVPGSVLVTDPGRSTGPIPAKLTLERVRPHQGRLLVTFEGIYDRDISDNLRGVLLCVDSADVLPTEDPDEFHDHQLVGLAAVTPDGESLGEVTKVDHAPAHDNLILRRPDGRSAIVPFVKAIVPEVDVVGGRVVITPPEGLFDL